MATATHTATTKMIGGSVNYMSNRPLTLEIGSRVSVRTFWAMWKLHSELEDKERNEMSLSQHMEHHYS